MEDTSTFIATSYKLLLCPITKFILSTELGNGHVETRETVSLEVWVLDIVSGNGWVQHRWCRHGSRHENRRTGFWYGGAGIPGFISGALP